MTHEVIDLPVCQRYLGAEFDHLSDLGDALFLARLELDCLFRLERLLSKKIARQKINSRNKFCTASIGTVLRARLLRVERALEEAEQARLNLEHLHIERPAQVARVIKGGLL